MKPEEQGPGNQEGPENKRNQKKRNRNGETGKAGRKIGKERKRSGKENGRMNKVGIYGALFFVCMILCHVLGGEFDFEYLYLAEIGLAAVSGIMLYMAIHELYRDIRAQRQSQQEYVEGLKNAVETLKDICQNVMEGFREENKSVMERFRAESRSAAESLGAECKEAIAGFNAENRKLIESVQTQNKKLIESFDVESRNMMECFSTENRNAMESFSEKNKDTIEGLKAANRNVVENLTKEIKNTVESFGMETKNVIEDFGMETKNTMERFGAETRSAMENFGAETKNTLEDFGAETKNAVEGFGAETKNAMESYGIETKNTMEDMRKFIISAEEASSQKQEKLEGEIRTICREQAEAAEASRKLLTETLQDMKQFVREESRILLTEFGKENKLQMEQFSENCDHYIERLRKECLAALERCSGLMGTLLPEQEALVKELRMMCQEQSENSNASRALVEEMESFVRDQTGEIRRENKALLEGLEKENKSNMDVFVQNCGEYTRTLQQECAASLEKCNSAIDEFAGECLDLMDDFADKSKSLFEDYNNYVNDSINNHWRRISETTNESQSALEGFIDKSEVMMEQLNAAVKKVNEENSQYIAQMKEYQKELKQLSSEDIKIMEEILHGNR